MRYHQKCLICGKIYSPNVHLTNCKCSGLIEFVYDLNGSNDFIDENYSDILRYWPLLPIKELRNMARIGGGMTPLFKSKHLGKLLELENLWIKDESKNPTATFKEREAGMTISRFTELGIREFVIASTGNTAASFSRAVDLVDSFKMHLFIPDTAEEKLDFPIPNSVNVHIVKGDYYTAIEQSSKYAANKKLTLEGGFGNPSRIEGVKTLAFEVVESGIEPDYYIQAIGSGVGPYAFYKGYSELARMGIVNKIPKIVCIQPELCAPIVRAYQDGEVEFKPEYKVSQPKTFVTTLANGNPASSYPYVRRVINKTNGLVQDVTEQEIKNAVKLMEETENISCEPAAGTSLAGLIKCLNLEKIKKDSVILLHHSGGLRN